MSSSSSMDQTNFKRKQMAASHDDKSLTEKGKDFTIRYNPYARQQQKHKELPIRKLMPLPPYKADLAEDLAEDFARGIEHSKNCRCSRFSTGDSDGFTIEEIRDMFPSFRGFDAPPPVEPQVEKPKFPQMLKPPASMN